MNKLAINNPKQLSDNDVRVNWYNYYAGFSNTFVKDVLRSSTLTQTSTVLDPWNGAGTTTTAVAEAGYNAVGVDLNPAMVIVARAKTASLQEVECAFNETKKLRVSKFDVIITADDFLMSWFDFDTAKYIRYLSKKIIGIGTDDISDLNTERCVMLVALFNVVRDLVKDFIPSNPTWIKKAKNENERKKITNMELKQSLLSYLKKIKQNLVSDVAKENGRLKLLSASSKSLPIESRSVDLVITSPPYCTRIDYGVATYPELAILFGDTPSKINSLRRELIGRTTIDKNSQTSEIVSCEARNFMNAVEEHISHASSNYYLKNYKQYFLDMQISMSEISRVMKERGVFVCVVQDSYYKEVYCNLSLIINEIAEKNGFELAEKKDFNVKSVMANIHSFTKKYRSKVTATESVLVFKKIRSV